MPTHAHIFDDIYINDLWHGGSGAGSREDSTHDYRAFLRKYMLSNGITSVVDMGCGDWQFSRYVDWTGIDYTGTDVSATVLKSTQQFTRPGIRFIQADATRDVLPVADLLIAKDVLQHWSNADIMAFIPQLQNFKEALITGSFPQAALAYVNVNMPTGARFRPVDPGKPPFNLTGEFVHSFVAGDFKQVFRWRRVSTHHPDESLA